MNAIQGSAFITVLSAAMMSEPVTAESSLTLWYDRPAKSAMNEALPIGNGRIGGLVFGDTASERIVLNENSLWTGDENPSGDYDSMGAYQLLGNLHLTLPQHQTVTNYRRELDISEATARVRYRTGGVNYWREYFCSQPDGVMVVRLMADKPGGYNGSIILADGHQAPTIAQPNRLSVAGALDNGMKYETRLMARHDGGDMRVEGDRIEFTNCNSLTILLAAGTDYSMDGARQWRGEAPHRRVTQQLDAAVKKSDSVLQAAHLKDYQSLFNRVKLDLGTSTIEQTALPTDQRKIQHAERGGDPGLEELMFQYGRYLLISCSRPGGLPANLQGLWNDSNTPPWHSDYHSNINVQMNYWPAEPTNLAECHEPFLKLIRSQLEAWRKATARAKEFKTPSGAMTTRGWAIRTSHNISGGMGWKWDKTANAWYCQHLWEHFAFNRDTKYLKQFAYPILKETCQFWEDHLKALPDNRLVVPDGWSPEHGPDEDGVSYNQQIVWDVFNNTVEASRVLNVDAAYRAKLIQMRDRLVGPKIGNWEQLQEWMTDRDDPNDHHRHTSHLFAVYPGRQISVASAPQLAAAAKKSLEARGESGDVREWSFAWRTALFARLHDGASAHRMFQQLFSTRNTCPNLFGLHPPMQMDGNFGITAGVAEMLLQSHEAEINLLPALPPAWPSGSVQGLRARSGFEIDMKWQSGKLVAARIQSTLGGVCKVRYGDKVVGLKTRRGASYRLDGVLRRIR